MQGIARRKQGSQVVSGVSVPLMAAFHAVLPTLDLPVAASKHLLQCQPECHYCTASQ